MYVIIICKYEKDPMKIAEKIWRRRFPFYKSLGLVLFFRRSRAANSVVDGWIWPNFELIQALLHVSVIANRKYEKDPIKSVK